ncbi:alpha/beta fold hydrolase [Frigidibacter sp. RF13]|uniref:alpha/beta hydrolase n=1 Tax=Frigidibacter sp. RF13 TaxID=2997340 RepID=UPI0022704B1F|nr:alpha/beta fold hydrolase [Frigidibacter sp. RF13]MCY1126409.1 alpha/beta fold hydrolase [Frigidibacter sp. RF13]
MCSDRPSSPHFEHSSGRPTSREAYEEAPGKAPCLLPRRAILALSVASLAACAARGAIKIVPEAKGLGASEQVFIGTTRGFDEETAEPFSYRRSRTMRYGRVDVSIPPEHRPGEIDWPAKKDRADPQTEFVATAQEIYDGAPEFRADLARALRQKRDAVIFVHGFNSTFAEGTYRLAQLGYDLQIGAVLVNYSWPSRARPLGYVYDRDSALFARDGLEELIRQVNAAGARRVTIVAHSLGSLVVMETLRQMAISERTPVLANIDGVVLMSPDIDVDVFHEQARRIGKLPQPFIIFTSKKDKALALSARLTGQRDRVGNLQSASELGSLEVTLIDTTAYSTGGGHFNVGNSPALLSILGRIADVELALAADRTGRPGLLSGVVLSVQNATQIILSPVSAIAN